MNAFWSTWVFIASLTYLLVESHIFERVRQLASHSAAMRYLTNCAYCSTFWITLLFHDLPDKGLSWRLDLPTPDVIVLGFQYAFLSWCTWKLTDYWEAARSLAEDAPVETSAQTDKETPR